MGINIRTKGAEGERQVANDLNTIVNGCYLAAGLPLPEKPVVQRNQNQSAVGGQDLVGTFGFAIEVKRQETLSINSWWKQCEKSALNLDQIPVLIFRQNKMAWRCITYAYVPISTTASIRVRAEIPLDEFHAIFRSKVNAALAANRPQQTEGFFS